MRLQLTDRPVSPVPATRLTAAIAGLVAAFVAGNANADGRVGTWLSVYSDDDRLTVVSPQLSVRADARDDVEVSAGYDVDVISSATVDVTTAASPRGYTEQRHGLRASLSWRRDAATQLALAYVPSWEPDYRSHALSAQLVREWRDRRLATKLDLRWVDDQVGRSGDEMFRWRDKTVLAAAGSVSWIFDPRTIGELTYELQLARGFLASAYRYVGVGWEDGSGIAVPEAVPDRRIRHAVAGHVRRALADSWYGRAGYRFYGDSWGVTSHTGDVELQRAFAADRIIAGASLRGYRQSGASFHREHYQTTTGMLPVYRSADKLLAPSWSVLGGLRVEVAHAPRSVVDMFRGVIKLELYDQHFSRFAFLRRRRALIVSCGASVEY